MNASPRTTLEPDPERTLEIALLRPPASTMAARKLAAPKRPARGRAKSEPARRPEPERWSVYMIRRADGALYTGIALDVKRRFAQHVEGKGAKALRGRGPLALVLRRIVGTHGAALRLERRVKQLTKAQKERLLVERSRLSALAREARSSAAVVRAGRRVR